MQELPNKIVSEIFGRAIGLLRPTIWLMAAASAIGGVVTLGTGTSILRAGKAAGATAMLQNWLRAQVENVSAVRSLHFVAVDHETISFPKGSTMYIHGAKGTVAVPVPSVWPGPCPTHLASTTEAVHIPLSRQSCPRPLGVCPASARATSRGALVAVADLEPPEAPHERNSFSVRRGQAPADARRWSVGQRFWG